jgi:hypothetical protein
MLWGFCLSDCGFCTIPLLRSVALWEAEMLQWMANSATQKVSHLPLCIARIIIIDNLTLKYRWWEGDLERECKIQAILKAVRGLVVKNT